MTPEYIREKLDMLPRFTVEKIERGPGQSDSGLLLTGSVSESLAAGETCMCLFYPDLDFFDGSMKEAKAELWYRSIDVWPCSMMKDLDRVRLGDELAMFPYDHRRLLLVIDPALEWELVEFEPQKALVQRIVGTDGSPLLKSCQYSEGDAVPEGAWIEEGSWDHQHCVFCWGKIDAEHAGYGCEDEKREEWVCKECYQKAVEPHDPSAM